MLYLSNYKNKLDELKNIHKFISKKVIILYIIFGLLQFLFIAGIVVLSIIAEDDPISMLILLFLILYLLSFLMFIPIIKSTNNFTRGNLADFVFDIVSSETGLTFSKSFDKKQIHEYIKENTNILYANSASVSLYVDIYDESLQNVMAKYMFVTITYSRYLSYLGYLIIIPNDKGKSDIKIFTKNFKQYAINFKEDKNNRTNLSYIYYNKKEEYKFNQELVDLHKKIDEYYNEYLSNKMSIGLLSKNNHLSIMFGNNPKIHPNFIFKHKMTDEYLEKLINSIIKDIELIKEIYNK